MPESKLGQYDILSDNEWVAWNASRLGLRTSTKRYTNEDTAAEVVLYSTPKGKLIQPDLTPYLALRVTKRGELADINSDEITAEQWIALASQLAEDLAVMRPSGYVPLPPFIRDVRPFQWAGFIAEPRYTYTDTLPYDKSSARRSARKQVRRATNRGYRVYQTVSSDDLVNCLYATASRKGFKSRLKAHDIESLIASVGIERVRILGVKDSSGKTVSAGIRLLDSDGTGLGWVQGTYPEYLSDGVAQLIQLAALDDLATAGAWYYDYMGANIASVSRAKSAWSMNLTPYYVLRLHSPIGRVKKNATMGAIQLRSRVHNRLHQNRTQ